MYRLLNCVFFSPSLYDIKQKREKNTKQEVNTTYYMASNRIFPTVWNEYTGNCNVDIRTWKIWTNINVHVKMKLKQRKSVCCSKDTPIYNDLNKDFLSKT